MIKRRFITDGSQEPPEIFQNGPVSCFDSGTACNYIMWQESGASDRSRHSTGPNCVCSPGSMGRLAVYNQSDVNVESHRNVAVGRVAHAAATALLEAIKRVFT